MHQLINATRHRDSHPDEPVARAVYTVKEVARLLSISVGGAYALVRDGTIPAERLGRRWVVSRRRFHDWLDSRTGEPSRHATRAATAPRQGRN